MHRLLNKILNNGTRAKSRRIETRQGAEPSEPSTAAEARGDDEAAAAVQRTEKKFHQGKIEKKIQCPKLKGDMPQWFYRGVVYDEEEAGAIADYLRNST